MSKGSGRRPQQVDDKKVSSEWDRLFKSSYEPSESLVSDMINNVDETTIREVFKELNPHDSK